MDILLIAELAAVASYPVPSVIQVSSRIALPRSLCPRSRAALHARALRKFCFLGAPADD